MDLAAWANPASPWEKLQDELVCLPCWHLSPSRPFSVFFFHVCGGWEVVLLPPTFTPAQKSLPSPLQEAKEGEGAGGGQGSPSVLRLHRVFRLNQENFYYQKRKRKKKKIPAATFPPCPIGTVKTGSVGLLGGWLRAGTLSGKSGGVPWQALRQALFGLLPSPHFFPPSSDPPEVAFPCPQALGLTGLYTEAQLGVLHSPGEGGRWDPGSLHTISSVLPQSWALPSMSCCGDMVPLLRSLCHLQAG